MRTFCLGVIVLFAVCNCTPAPTVTSGMPDGYSQAPDGIYSFEQQTLSDNCQPRAQSGDHGQVGVIASDAGYFLPYRSEFKSPASGAITRDEFPWSGSTKTYTFSAFGCDAGVEVEFSKKMLSAGTTLEASLTRKYTVPAGCNPSISYMNVPSSSCVVEQKLRGTLVTPCEKPCLMKVNLAPLPTSGAFLASADGGLPGDTVTCECPN